jgi:putative Mg2+ transporter-C (MgtC) family protein
MTSWTDFLTTFTADLTQIGKILGAATLGILIGYERSFHGRAAGMRTYALVAMASAMLVMIHGWPSFWPGDAPPKTPLDDATRVIQGIVTGIGFLGAGVIMRDGFSIRGLSTAASIWLTAAVGVLVGLGFYVTAVFATLVTMLIMSEVRILEHLLPHQVLLRLELSFRDGAGPAIAALRPRFAAYGFEITDWSIKTTPTGRLYELALKGFGRGIDEQLADHLAAADDLSSYLLAPSHS